MIFGVLIMIKKSFICFILSLTLIFSGIFSVMALDTSNIVPAINNPHLIRKVAAKDGTTDTHQWVTDYDEENQFDYYCYPYSIGVTNYAFDPGDTLAKNTLINTIRNKYLSATEVAKLILTDLEKFGASGEILTGENSRPNYKTKQNQYLLAVRVTPRSKYISGYPDASKCYNYHVMRRINASHWRYKAGLGGKVIQLDDGYTPEDITWDTITLKANKKDEYDFIQKDIDFYSSDIVYILVTQNSPIIVNSAFFPDHPVEDVHLVETSKTLGIGASYRIIPVFNPTNASDQNIFWSGFGKVGKVKGDRIFIRGAGQCNGRGLCNGKKSIILDFSLTVRDIKLGDVNNDGEINVTDATEIQKYIAKYIDFNEEQTFAADVNSDGDVNVIDATEVQKYVAEIIDYFTVVQ